jgi:hypothetical protein
MPRKSRRHGRLESESWTLAVEGGRRGAADWVSGDDDPFSQWLGRSLHEAFDAVAREPIPEDILRLIEEDRDERERLRRRRAAKGGG